MRQRRGKRPARRARLTPDRRVAAIARARKGVVTVAELRAAGVGDNGIARRVAAGRLQRLETGVYFVGAGPVPTRAGWLAGVLAAGEGAVLSHESAAGLWGMLDELVSPVHVTIRSPANRRSRPGLRIHRSRTLRDEDVTARDGIPVTTPLRTLEDLPRRLRGRAGTAALVHRLVTALPADPGRPLTRSQAERRFLRLCRRAGLPAPEVNVLVEGRERDMTWRAERLVVEVDGPHHDAAPQRRLDRVRDRELLLAGWRVLRFGTDELRDEDGVAAAVRAALAAGEPPGPTAVATSLSHTDSEVATAVRTGGRRGPSRSPSSSP